MTQYGFYVNTDICIGCKACMTSCFDRNDLEVPEQFRKIYEFGGGEWFKGAYDDFTNTAFAYYLSLTCCHCDMPICVATCPTGSMTKDWDTGIVNNDKDTCNGCLACKENCPYNHPVLRADGLAHKCALCSEENEDSTPAPVCHTACPVRALEFAPIEDLRAKHGDNDTIADLGNTTKPNVVINPHRSADKGGKLLNPSEVNR